MYQVYLRRCPRKLCQCCCCSEAVMQGPPGHPQCYACLSAGRRTSQSATGSWDAVIGAKLLATCAQHGWRAACLSKINGQAHAVPCLLIPVEMSIQLCIELKWTTPPREMRLSHVPGAMPTCINFSLIMGVPRTMLPSWCATWTRYTLALCMPPL